MRPTTVKCVPVRTLSSAGLEEGIGFEELPDLLSYTRHTARSKTNSQHYTAGGVPVAHRLVGRGMMNVLASLAGEDGAGRQLQAHATMVRFPSPSLAPSAGLTAQARTPTLCPNSA